MALKAFCFQFASLDARVHSKCRQPWIAQAASLWEGLPQASGEWGGLLIPPGKVDTAVASFYICFAGAMLRAWASIGAEGQRGTKHG